ncbi:transcription factor Sox-3-like isoform X2 [Zophobas morio]|uniref:transcription factor Sox-3-like isoform X2 n=1 Tax=Zophobas morio TaxID=2755281 RepID=UPI00308298FB
MNFCIKREFCDANRERARIPRPPNAFMLYANENRKKMSQLYPTESNKDISKRLGSGWKCLDEEERKRFFDRAKAIGLQHKREYPDYVYNPKEARIRKAMRDATRERTSIGTSPMLQRPNARRAPSSHSWVPPPPPPSHDDLMMQPLGGLQAPPPVCGFPLPPSSPGEQFLGAMNAAYSKMEPAPPPPMPPPTTNYMQSNPLAQLQQHAEMWPEYQAMRPRSSGNPFMMGDVPPYSAQPPEMGTPLMMEKEPTPATSPPTNDPEPDKEQEQEHFLPVFEPDESKMKKPCGDLLHLPLSSQSFRASPSLFSHDINYQNNYILEYFQSMPAMTLINVTTPNGTTFPYATYSPSNLLDNVNNETQVFENITEPIFFHTDVGFVPMSSM